jgi:hypothetical protein
LLLYFLYCFEYVLKILNACNAWFYIRSHPTAMSAFKEGVRGALASAWQLTVLCEGVFGPNEKRLGGHSPAWQTGIFEVVSRIAHAEQAMAIDTVNG